MKFSNPFVDVHFSRSIFQIPLESLSVSGNRLSSVPPLALVPASAVASVNNEEEEEEEEDGDSKKGEKKEERRVSRLRELDLSRNDISVLVREYKKIILFKKCF